MLPPFPQLDEGRVPRDQLRAVGDGGAQEDRGRRLQGEAPRLRPRGGGVRPLMDGEGALVYISPARSLFVPCTYYVLGGPSEFTLHLSA